MSDEITGVDETAVAGQQEEFTKEYFMDEPEEEVVEKEEVAEETVEEASPEEVVEKAFAERLKHATKKIREEVKAELMQEIRQPPSAGEIPPLQHEDAERMADQYGTTPEVIQAMYMQQATLNRQAQDMQRIALQIQEREEHAQARAYCDAVRKKNPNAPEWDDDKLRDFRDEYQRQYGVSLSWRDTYRQLVAEEALNPATYKRIARDAQQDAINKITSKDRDTVKIQGQTARKRSIAELSGDDFQRLVEDAKAGKFA